MPVYNSPRAYGRVRNPLLKKENKNHKNLSQRKLTKTKAKEIVAPVPMPREDPKTPRKKHLLSRHDATEAQKGHVPVLCYRGKQEIRLLTLYYSQFTEETSQDKTNQRRQ